MTRLEFVGFSDVEEFKNVMNALVKGEEYVITYKDKEGVNQRKILAKNGRLYVGSNFSVSLSQSEDKKIYLGVDYLSSDDRISMRKNSKIPQTDLF